MAAITWQNIPTNSDRAAVQLMEQARMGVTGGLDTLSKTLQDRMIANEAANTLKRDDQQTAYLNQLQGITTPQDLLAARESLKAPFNALDPRNQAVVRDAFEKRLAGLQTQTGENQKFADTQTSRDNRDPVNQAMAKAAGGDVAGGMAILEPIKHLLPNFGDVVSHMQTAADNHAKLLADTGAVGTNAAANTSNAASNAAQVLIAQQQANIQSRNTDLQFLERAAALRAGTAEKLAAVGSSTIGGPNGLNTVMDRISKSGAVDKDLIPKVTSYVAEAISKNPAYQGLPTDVVENIILKHTNNIGSWYNPTRWGSSSDIAKDLDAAVKDPAIQERIAHTQDLRKNLQGQLSAQTLQMDASQTRAFPDLQKILDARAAAKLAATPDATPPGTVQKPLVSNTPTTSSQGNMNRADRVAEPAILAPAVSQGNVNKLDRLAAQQEDQYGYLPGESVSARLKRRLSVSGANLKAALRSIAHTDDPTLKKAKRS